MKTKVNQYGPFESCIMGIFLNSNCACGDCNKGPYGPYQERKTEEK